MKDLLTLDILESPVPIVVAKVLKKKEASKAKIVTSEDFALAETFLH